MGVDFTQERNNPTEPVDTHDNGAGEGEGRDVGRRRLVELFDSDGVPDLEVIAGPLFWPGVPADDIQGEWRALREWVGQLVARYPHLDHHVIPPCWWRHPGHVEALQALRDHERVSFAESAPGSAATDWQWRFALIEGRLREWTAHSGCGASHRDTDNTLPPPAEEQWDAMVDKDRARRQQREEAGILPVPGGTQP